MGCSTCSYASDVYSERHDLAIPKEAFDKDMKMASFKFCDKCERSYANSYQRCIYCGGMLREVPGSSPEVTGTGPTITESIWTYETAADYLFKDITDAEQKLTKDGQVVTSKKYLHQAMLIQDRMGLYRPCNFVVSEQDLKPATLQALKSLNKKGLDYVFRTVLFRMYELISPEAAAISDLKRVTFIIVSKQ